MNDIRIGTLVNGDDGAPYVKQIVPHGFESISITFWEKIGVDLERLAEGVRAGIGDADVTVSSLGVFGNPLENTASAEAWEQAIDRAHLFGASVIAGFAGRLTDRPVDESLPRFKEVFAPLARRAADKGLRLAFENCDMEGNWEHGGWNIAFSPAAWEMMFNEVPDDNVGLEWDPSHSMGAFIDPIGQLRTWVGKVFHVHGKDATMNWDVIRSRGIKSTEPYYEHRTPGFGDLNWTDVISVLRMGGFVGSIDIEGWHDPVYTGELEMTGQVAALHYLKRCRGGELVPNPT